MSARLLERAGAASAAGSCGRRELATPAREVARIGTTRLLRFEPTAEVRHPEPVLLVPSIINRPYILDLTEARSFAGALLASGFRVYLVDWQEPDRRDAHLDLGGYAVTRLGWAIGRARADASAARVHLLGYCLGGTFALIADAARVPGIGSIVALTTPVDLAAPGALDRLTASALLDLDLLCEAHPVVPARALWTAFQALDPLGRLRVRTRRLTRPRAGGESEVEAAQQTWLTDPVAMTARVVRDLVGRLYRENALWTGRLCVAGLRVRLEDGRAPVLNLIASGDTLVPPACAEGLAERWGGPCTHAVLRAGHLGIAVGGRASTTWQQSAAFFANAQTPLHPRVEDPTDA